MFQIFDLSKSAIANNLGNIEEVLERTPELKNYPSELWQKTHTLLVQEGFSSNKFTFILSNNPKLLIKSEEKLLDNLNCWRAFQFGEKNTITLLENYPELFEVNHSIELTKRLETLKVFVGNYKNVFKLLMTCPSIVQDKLSILEEKIKYLQNTMRVEVSEITKSCTFSHELEKIKMRHVFLERLGMYQAKSKKADPLEPSKNPKLYQIMDTSDKRFATKVCYVTLEEYETFMDLYKKEISSMEDDDLSDNDEDVEYIDFDHRKI